MFTQLILGVCETQLSQVIPREKGNGLQASGPRERLGVPLDLLVKHISGWFAYWKGWVLAISDVPSRFKVLKLDCEEGVTVSTVNLACISTTVGCLHLGNKTHHWLRSVLVFRLFIPTYFSIHTQIKMLTFGRVFLQQQLRQYRYTSSDYGWHMQAYKRFSQLLVLCVVFWQHTAPAEQEEDGNVLTWQNCCWI